MFHINAKTQFLRIIENPEEFDPAKCSRALLALDAEVDRLHQEIERLIAENRRLKEKLEHPPFR